MNLGKTSAFIFVSAIALATSGCGVIGGVFEGVSSVVGLSDHGTVIVRRAQIRSSYSVVAADLLEVKRGDQLVITDQVEFGNVLWYHVRANDDDQTEGWIEAQNLITDQVLEKSRKLAEEDTSLQAQATGQLRAKSNLRLSPEQREDNILYKLDSDTTFEILSWQYVPKAQDVADIDDVSRGGTKREVKKSRNAELEAAKEAEEANKMENKYDIWYRVRLSKDVSPAPAGWLFGRQVQLQIPSDISFFESSNRKFISWFRLDGDTSKEDGKMASPGSYIILTRSNMSKAIDGIEPDFDGILVLVFDKYDQSHYTAYRTLGEIWGQVPMNVEGSGDNRSFTLKMRNSQTGAMEERRFVMFKDRNRLRITPPSDMANYEAKKAK